MRQSESVKHAVTPKGPGLSAPARRVLWLGALVSALGGGWVFAELHALVNTRSEESELEAALLDHQQRLVAEVEPGVERLLPCYPVPLGSGDPPTFPVRLNRLNFREREFDLAAPRGKLRIVAVGDSVTFGTGVLQAERFTERLAALLDQRRPACCEVLNAGRAGMSTQAALVVIRDTVLAWSPDLLILGTMTNDSRDPERPSRLRDAAGSVRAYVESLRAVLDLSRTRGVGVVLWGNTIGGWRDVDPLRPLRAAQDRVARETGTPSVDLDAVYAARPASADEQAAFLRERPFTAVWPKTATGPLSRLALHADWAHPNRFGHLRLAEALLPDVLTFVDRASSVRVVP